MSDETRRAFVNAALAHASYTDGLVTDMTGEPLSRALRGQLTSSLAGFIADRYRVVSQTNHASSGFSVTVFSELATGQRYISFRGSQELLDFAGADADIAFGDGTAYFQLMALVNWYTRASTPQGAQAIQLADTWQLVNGQRMLDTYVVAGTGELAGSPDWIVNGHSLGGHLTTAFARLFGNSATKSFTYNGAGFLDSANEVFAIIERSLGIASTAYPGPLRQKNFFAANGVTFASNDWWLQQFGQRIALFNELGAPLSNHSIYKLTDSLALADVLAEIDNALSLDQIRGILDAGSASAPASLESVLDAIRRLYQVADQTPTQVGDVEDNAPTRADFHAKLADARSAVSAVGGTSLVSLVGQTADDSVAQATGSDGLPFRYALKELNPFAVIDPSGALYARFQTGGAQQGELDLFASGANRAGSLTPDWVRDRAALLQAQMLRSIADHATLAFLPGSGDTATEFHHYRNGTEEVFFAEPTIRLQSPLRTQVVSFADDSGRVLEGSDNALADRLYGGAGTDALQGKAGDDRLEGGGGLDLYQYSGARQTPLFGSPTLRNDGNDTVLDTDGRGVLRYSFTDGIANPTSTVIFDASVKVNSVTWQSADGKFSYIRSGADLLIVINGDAFGTVRLKEFRDGDFGIRLNEGVAVPLDPVRTFYGDKQDWDVNPNEDGIQPAPDGFGNFIRADGLDDRPDIDEPSRADRFFGSTQQVVERFAAAGGNDTLLTDGPSGETGGADLVEAGEGRDIVWSGPGHDFIEGGFDGTSVEVVDGQSLAVVGGDVLNAGPGDDALYGLFHSDLAVAIRNGEADLSQNRKGDFLSGHDGDDRAIGVAENDALLGGDGRDVLVGGAGDDDFGGDLAYGAATLEWQVTRTIAPQENGTVLYQLAFLNMLGAPIPEGAADVIYGGAGADWALGGGGDDFIDSGSGDDFSAGEAGADLLIGGTGNDVLVGDNGPGGTNDAGDYLDGGVGNDSLQGDGGDDILVGGPGEDTLAGGAGKDIYLFDLGDGIETVFDTGGDDPANPAERSIVILGEGLSRNGVKFRTGSLMVDFGTGDALHFSGFDQINPVGTPLIGEIRFVDGSSISYLDILAQGFDIDGTEEDDDGHDADHAQLTGTGVVDRIRGFGGNDGIFGFGDNDLLDAGAGADQIVGGAGRDTITAGDGDDLVWADEDSLAGAEHGDDSVSGGAGNDGIRGYGGNDFLAGDEGADLLWGEAGADTLDGGSGADTLTGHTGDDTYVFARGNGADLIVDQDSTFGNVDTVEFAAGISADEVIGRRGTTFPNDLVLTLWNTADSLTIADHFRSTSDRVEQIRFADGTVITPDAIPTLMRGTAGSDFLSGTSGRDALEGLAGNDWMEGGAGDDRYHFRRGDGQDTILDADSAAGNVDKIVFAADIAPAGVTARRSGSHLVLTIAGTSDQVTVYNHFVEQSAPIYSIEQIRFLCDGSSWDSGAIKQKVLIGTAGNDSILGFAGDDAIDGFDGNDTLDGALGSDTLGGGNGADQLFGRAGADVFSGGPGADWLSGETGNDTYFFERGAGVDLITDLDDTGSNVDRIVFAEGVAPSEVSVSRFNEDLRLSSPGSGDQVSVATWFRNDASSGYLVERIEFADGTFWDVDTVKNMALTGTEGPDGVTGYATADLLVGLGGNDALSGRGGDDTLDGGAGNDNLAGHAGSDTYLLARGHGQDQLSDGVVSATDIDRVVYAADILPSDVSVSRSGLDLLLALSGGSDLLRVSSFFEASNNPLPYSIERFEFSADGTVWDVDDVKAMALASTPGGDTIIGYESADSLYGGAGPDSIYGGLGDDTLDGGPGFDYLQGDGGSDTYLFSRGTGYEHINNSASDGVGPSNETTDVLLFAADIGPSQVVLSRNYEDLAFSITGSPDAGKLESYFFFDPLEEIRFADGTVWTGAAISAQFPTLGTSGSDVLNRNTFDDTVYGLAGNDSVRAGGGDDTVDGGLGSDLLYGESGNDVLIGGTGEAKNAVVSNRLYGGDGDDVLIAGGNAKSAEQLDGGFGSNILLGGAGPDSLVHYNGTAVLYGGAGADNLQSHLGGITIAIGGPGNDTFSPNVDPLITYSPSVIAFNKSDGIDTVRQLGRRSTISLGGVLYGNLSLEASGTGLRLHTGSGNYLNLSDWYSSDPKVPILQIVIDGTRDYKPGSSNPMNNAKVQGFDFIGLVSAFDAARASGQNFNVAANLPRFRFWGVDTQAIGGAIAYQYATTGSLSALSYEQMQDIIRDASFAFGGVDLLASGSSAVSSTVDEVAMASSDGMESHELFEQDSHGPVEQDRPARRFVSMPEAPLPPGLSRRADTPEPMAVPRLHARGEPAKRFSDPAQAVPTSASIQDRNAEVANARPLSAMEDALLSARPEGVQAEKKVELHLAEARNAAWESNQSESQQTANATAWLRAARDLPMHLDHHLDSGIVIHRFRGVSLGAGLAAASLHVVDAVGLQDAGHIGLRKFEGLREGFSALA